MIPWLLTRFGQSGLNRLARKNAASQFWPAFLIVTDRYRWWVLTGTMGVIAVCSFGLVHLRASVEVDGFFEPDSPVVQSIANLERQLGPLDQTEAIVIFNQADPDDFVQRYQYVRRLQAAWLKLDHVDVAHSLLNYLPIEPKQLTGPSLIKRTIFRRKLKSQRDTLANGLFLKVNGDQEMWRISLRFPFTQKSDFANWQNPSARLLKRRPRHTPPRFRIHSTGISFYGQNIPVSSCPGNASWRPIQEFSAGIPDHHPVTDHRAPFDRPGPGGHDSQRDAGITGVRHTGIDQQPGRFGHRHDCQCCLGNRGGRHVSFPDSISRVWRRTIQGFTRTEQGNSTMWTRHVPYHPDQLRRYFLLVFRRTARLVSICGNHFHFVDRGTGRRRTGIASHPVHNQPFWKRATSVARKLSCYYLISRILMLRH